MHSCLFACAAHALHKPLAVFPCRLPVCPCARSWSPARSASSSSGLSQGALLAAIIVPVIFFSILLGTILACMFCKRLNTLQQEDLDAAGKDVDGTNRRGSSSTSALAWLGLGRRSGGGPGASMGKAGPHVVVSVKDGAASSITGTDSPGSASPLAALEEQQASVNRTMSGSGSKSKTKSAFDADIAQVRIAGVLLWWWWCDGGGLMSA